MVVSLKVLRLLGQELTHLHVLLSENVLLGHVVTQTLVKLSAYVPDAQYLTHFFPSEK